jgi:hypothetical protein
LRLRWRYNETLNGGNGGKIREFAGSFRGL